MLFYNGDLDGIFGPETYKAIMEYQKAMGTNADGMWGESTNSFHRVLNATNAPYRNDTSGPSGAHTSYVPGINTGQKAPAPRKRWATQNDMYRDIQSLKQKYYSNGGDNWFWSEDPTATQWREFLNSTKEGRDILNEFYGDAAAQGKRVDRRLMNTEQKQLAYNTGIQNAINKAGRAVVGTAGALATPLMVAASPLVGLGAVAGSAVGSKIGGDLAQNLFDGDTAGYTAGDQYYGQIPTATDAGAYYRPAGEIAGGIAGGVAGGAFANNINPGMPRVSYGRNNFGDATKGYYSWRSQYTNSTGKFTNPTKAYATPSEVPGPAKIADTPGLVGSRELHVGSFAPREWRPQSTEFLNYLEGAGGNPAYSPRFSFKNGGILSRNI